MMIKETAPAKINLFLEITGKRPDGYHTINTIFQKISLADTLIFRQRNDKKIRLKIKKMSPDLPKIPDDKRNLIMRTAQILQKEFLPISGAEITLRKKIPVGAGLGGGSSDAAATIQGLDKLWKLKLSLKQKLEIARQIGADVSFFLYPYSWALATSIGDKILDGGKTKKIYLLLVKPHFSISTVRAYSLITPAHLTHLKENTKIKKMLKAKAPVTKWVKLLFNRFEEVLYPEYPDLTSIKKMLIDAGALNALLSGSGSAIFGIFSDEKSAQVAGRNIQKALPKSNIFLVNSI